MLPHAANPGLTDLTQMLPMPALQHQADHAHRSPLPDQLPLRIVAGEATAHERFTWALRQAGIARGSLGTIAARLGIHRSALSPSNFKLGPDARQAAATLLGIPAGFLQPDPEFPADLPAKLVPLWHAVQCANGRAGSQHVLIEEDLRRQAETYVRQRSPRTITLPAERWQRVLDALRCEDRGVRLSEADELAAVLDRRAR